MVKVWLKEISKVPSGKYMWRLKDKEMRRCEDVKK